MKTRLLFLTLVVLSVRAGAQAPPSEPPMVTDEQGNEGQDPNDGDQGQDGYGYVEGGPDDQQQQNQQQYQQQPENLPPPSEDAEPVEMNTVNSVQAFEPGLAPYGDWVASNGVRAWRPSPSVVGNDFVPYASAGQWVSTEAGWSFSSSLPFGWATFHYGRWWFDPSYGWVWIPDTTWGPSWVEWRYGGGYAGWAPLAPLAFSQWARPRWYFVPSSYMCSRDLYRYAVPYSHYNSVYGVTVGMPTRYYHGVNWHVGPAWREVARVSVVPPPRRSMVTFGQPTHVAVGAGGGYRGYNPGGYNRGGSNPGGYSSGGYNRGGYNPGGYNRGGYNSGGYHPASPPPPSGGVVHGAPSGNYGGYSHNQGTPPVSGGFVPPSHGGYTPPPSHGGYAAPTPHYSSPTSHYSPPTQSHSSAPVQSHSAPAPSPHSSGGNSGAHRH